MAQTPASSHAQSAISVYTDVSNCIALAYLVTLCICHQLAMELVVRVMERG
jgi:hypothetical protein